MSCRFSGAATGCTLTLLAFDTLQLFERGGQVVGHTFANEFSIIRRGQAGVPYGLAPDAQVPQLSCRRSLGLIRLFGCPVGLSEVGIDTFDVVTGDWPDLRLIFRDQRGQPRPLLTRQLRETC
ncbi:MAG: hypothetical protein ACRDRE_19825 [Pseudonocardiaceae bacterium]